MPHDYNPRDAPFFMTLIEFLRLNYDPNNLDKMNGVHERSAARLLHVCRKNG
jgi:hypothetical protein